MDSKDNQDEINFLTDLLLYQIKLLKEKWTDSDLASHLRYHGMENQGKIDSWIARFNRNQKYLGPKKLELALQDLHTTTPDIDLLRFECRQYLFYDGPGIKLDISINGSIVGYYASWLPAFPLSLPCDSEDDIDNDNNHVPPATAKGLITLDRESLIIWPVADILWEGRETGFFLSWALNDQRFYLIYASQPDPEKVPIKPGCRYAQLKGTNVTLSVACLNDVDLDLGTATLGRVCKSGFTIYPVIRSGDRMLIYKKDGSQEAD